jgi:RHS repeat-associated protein
LLSFRTYRLKRLQQRDLDYHPLGMQAEHRSWSSGDGYRFGFQGQEGDDEVAGEGNSYDFGAKIYDSRLGRWMSVDPMASLQPSLSTYKAFLDNPIFFVDPEGETEKKVLVTINERTGKQSISVTTDNRVMTDGKRVMAPSRSSPRGLGYQANAYYDFTTTTYVVIDEEGKQHILPSVSKIDYNKGIQSYDGYIFYSDDAGDTKRDGYKTSVDGGIMFYSSSGGGGESKKTTGAVDMVDIDPIVAALSVFAPGGGLAGKLKTVAKANRSIPAQNVMKHVDKILEGTETVGEILDKGHTVKDNIEATQRKSARTATDSVPCSKCNRTVNTETKLGEGDAEDYSGHDIKQ